MALSASTLSVGETRSQVVAENLTRTQIVMYAGASGDYNPIHTDEVYVTESAGYRTVFAHGMLSMGATGKVLTDWVGNGRLAKYGVRFVNQVWPGDTLTATATVTAVGVNSDGQPTAEFSVRTVNQDGKDVVVGTATARLEP
jgi:acyl dehydratase